MTLRFVVEFGIRIAGRNQFVLAVRMLEGEFRAPVTMTAEPPAPPITMHVVSVGIAKYLPGVAPDPAVFDILVDDPGIPVEDLIGMTFAGVTPE